MTDGGPDARSLAWENRAWLARVRSGSEPSDAIVGTAFAIDARHVVSCAHVVNAAGASGPGTRVFVDFPLLGGRGSWATVLSEGWRPAPGSDDPQSAGDVAVLRLEDDRLPIAALPLRRRWSYNGLPFSCYGFPRPHAESDVAHGELGLRVGLEWLRVEAKAAALVEPGFSGAPIWVEAVGGAVAMMLTRKAEDGRVAYAIPIETIAKTSPVVAAALSGAADPLGWLDRVPAPLAIDVIPFRRDIARLTADFVGRRFVFDAIDQRIRQEDFTSGYIIIRGEPGIGKSAIMAQLARTRGYVHHFNNARQGPRPPTEFLRAASAQLLVRYDLPFEGKGQPDPTTKRLETLLEQAAAVARDREDGPVVLLVDALDEAPTPSGLEQRLLLPETLPMGTYVIATIRNHVPEHLYVTNRADDIMIEERGAANKADILTYVRAYFDRYPVMRDRLETLRTTEDDFLETIWTLSEGNFMYLHHVLADISVGTKDQVVDLKKLPQGLKEYYKQHWTQMKDRDRQRYRRLQEPVICVLAKARDAVPSQWIAGWINHSKAFDRVELNEVEDVLTEWAQFIDKSPDDPPRYRLYHNTFLEFLSREVPLERYGRAIADAMDRAVDWDAM